MRYGKLSISVLYSYTGVTYADALNMMEPSPTTPAVGRVPAYGLPDINSTFRINNHLQLRVNVNNLTNKQYFTKRPSFYPDPGVWTLMDAV